ncbi:uncharacterized protein LACBIDRAFT_321349 [Laccaria bicolor S238N-H82]|uniref:Uncharacterized protein n=1 Tax=Laccaria bicolor (strain S238N-H82 / ATCC MYA-4686) TaxID=486041 RepID=B0CPW3_LACBS|nr:uncharacterized protein LACBIDRAFT_321349 [Laccaria bicolor S238N-H82]EDR16134.1 hypothetical protein LACBIDRAFT_321349 [Laccaria bicolor S238N-H82]|eukprot:XP_001874342.1 hypothetical protein LACBIDRAFT_321349 [Laccaria bicolor S238N-H82]
MTETELHLLETWGKGKGQVKAKSAEVVESNEGREAPVTKEKGKAIAWVEIDEEVPAVKKKKEAKRAQVEEDDDEYNDEEDAPKGKKKAPELYNLILAKEGQLKKNLVLRFPTDPTDPIFEPPKTTDRYVKEARRLERDEKEAGASRKKGGKGGKWGPFYWGPHDQLDFEGPVSFKYTYDPERNPINENGIRRYLIADVFAMPCTKCTTMKKPYFFAGGEPTPLGRQRTIIDHLFYKDGLLYKKSTPKPAVPKATVPKNATPKLVAPKTVAPTPAPKQAVPIPVAPKHVAPKQAAPKPEAPVAVKVAVPSKPQVKGIVPNSPCPMLSEMSFHPTNQFNCPAHMGDHIITLEKQCRRLVVQVEETREKLNSVIKEWKEDVAELLLKLKKMEQSVTSTKDWTMQKVIFTMESLFLFGNGIHAVLLELVTKMTDLLEEMGTLVLVESDDSVGKVKELLEHAKPNSTFTGTAHGTDMAPTIAPSTPAPALNAPSRLQSPIAAKQQSVVATATAGVAPAAPSSPTAPNTKGVELAPVEVGPGSPLTAIGSHPTSPQSGDEQNTSTGRKRKADEEVDTDITRKKPASNRKKGPLSAPQRRQPVHGKAPDSVNPVTAGQSSKPDTIIEEDL